MLYTDQNSNMAIIHVFQWHPTSHWLWHIVVGLAQQLNFQHLGITLRHPETRYLQSSQYWYTIAIRCLRLLTPFIQVKHIEADMLSCLTFLPRALLTATKYGHVKMWVRPLVTPGNPRRRTHGRQPLSISDLQDVV